MVKIKKVISIDLIGREVPSGNSGGTGYCEYADLKVEYEGGESVSVRVSDYYTHSTEAFKELYERLPSLGNPREAFDMLVSAVPNLFEGNYEDLPTEFQRPKKEATKGKRKYYRIRKLTPRECFRLMGVRDDDIDKISSAGISESQQYKLAGNSIVVDVLFHGIYENLFLKDGIPEGQLF